MRAGISLIAPPLFPVEVDSSIRKRVHNGSLTVKEGVQAYKQLDAIPVQIVEELGLRYRSREIAEQFNQRLVYDSLYAALADLRRCELWTADTRFNRVVKADLQFVKHIAEYVAYQFSETAKKYWLYPKHGDNHFIAIIMNVGTHPIQPNPISLISPIGPPHAAMYSSAKSEPLRKGAAGPSPLPALRRATESGMALRCLRIRLTPQYNAV